MPNRTSSTLIWRTFPRLLPLLLMWLSACGGASTTMRYEKATPEQERVFDHGVDFVAALEGLEGRWREDWDRDLQERVAGADFIGIVKIGTMLTETDPEQRVTYRLVGKVKRTLAGEDLSDIELRVRQGQPGFRTVQGNLQRIESREFVAYVKWYIDDHAERAAHFHLSPASEQIVSQTESIASIANKGPAKPSGGRTVIHTH